MTATIFLPIVGIFALLVLFWVGLIRKKSAALSSSLLSMTEQQNIQKRNLDLYRGRDHCLFYDGCEAMFIFDQSDGSLLEANREATQLLGYATDEVRNLNFKALFSREQRQRLLRLVKQARDTGQAKAQEVKIRRKDGSFFVGEVKLKTGRINNEKIIYGSFHDTTEISNLQRELQRHNRHLLLLNQISQRVAEGHDLAQTLEIILDEVIRSFSISGGGIFLLAHQGAEMTLALHRNIPENVVEELRRFKPGMGLVGKVIKSGRPKMSTNLKDDHRRISSAVFADNWRAFLAVPFIAEEQPLGVLFVFDRGQRMFNRDDVRLIQAIGRQLGPIVKNAELFDELQWQHKLNFASMRELEKSRSALRNNLTQLEQHHRALQSLNQMKSSFLSLASHELRTPLTAIMSGAEFLQEMKRESIGANELRAMEVVIRSSRRLNDIVDNLLEAAKLEARSLYIARETFNPILMVKELVKEHAPDCTERGIDLELHDFPERAVVRGDVHHLKRALSRLLENAAKFTPQGGWIHIGGRQVSKDQILTRSDFLAPFSHGFFEAPMADGYLEISVTDSGIGLEAEDQLRIFEKFHEVGDISLHSSSRASFGGKGVGLGLTLVRGIIETHDGLIWVESEGPNRGSRFCALLPLCRSREALNVVA